MCGLPYLMLLPINFMNRIPILLINNISNRHLILHRTNFLQTAFVSPNPKPLPPTLKASFQKKTHAMRRILHKLMRIPKTPMAHIQPLRLAASGQILRVEGRVLWRDAQIAQHDVADILRAMHWRASGRAVLGRGDGGWQGECHLAVGWREGR